MTETFRVCRPTTREPGCFLFDEDPVQPWTVQIFSLIQYVRFLLTRGNQSYTVDDNGTICIGRCSKYHYCLLKKVTHCALYLHAPYTPREIATCHRISCWRFAGKYRLEDTDARGSFFKRSGLKVWPKSNWCNVGTIRGLLWRRPWTHSFYKGN
jgi:hypothetical protein